MTAIVDYGVGNLFSLRSSLAAIGEDCAVTGDADAILSADRVILPGVGAFGDAAEKLRKTGLDETVRAAVKKGTPLLGICLGMQLLFERSFEYGEHEGLGLLRGEVVPIPAGVKIPHIGWNSLKLTGDCPIFKYIGDGDYVYFVHSYYAENCADSVAATTEYGVTLTAAAAKGKVFGCQFHPEKSGEVGLKILRAFCEVER